MNRETGDFFMRASIVGRVPKRIFIFLLGISVLAIIMVGYGAWYLIFNPGGTVVHRLILFVLVGMLWIACQKTIA